MATLYPGETVDNALRTNSVAHEYGGFVMMSPFHPPKFQEINILYIATTSMQVAFADIVAVSSKHVGYVTETVARLPYRTCECLDLQEFLYCARMGAIQVLTLSLS